MGTQSRDRAQGLSDRPTATKAGSLCRSGTCTVWGCCTK